MTGVLKQGADRLYLLIFHRIIFQGEIQRSRRGQPIFQLGDNH